jgi:hypothetical protein
VRLLYAGLVAATACGRIDFDERRAAIDATPAIDAPADMMLSLGHDEDGDGIPDANDPCPHVPGDATDTDGDGVGDDCDVNPTTPSEHWVLFSTMQAGDQPFDDISAFTQEADALRTTTDAGPNINISLVRARVDVGWEIHAVLGAAGVQHQIAYGFDDTQMLNSEYYFNELNESTGGTFDAALYAYDATNGYQPLASMDPGMLRTGVGFSRVDMRSTTTNARIGWTPSPLYDLSAATPGYVACDHIRFSFHGLDVSIRYVAIITSG